MKCYNRSGINLSSTEKPAGVRVSKGFTLIEVIVALGIIAIAMAAAMTAVTVNVRNAAGLKDRTFAHWVAMNKMAELLIRNDTDYPAASKTTGTALMAQHEWYWEQEVVKFEKNDTLRRVYIRVRANEKDEFTMATLEGYVRKPD
jgi:general secretion pathway protein I